MHGIQVLLLVHALAVPQAGADALSAQSQRGKELMAAGSYAEAVPVYRGLVAALPDNPGLLLNLGMALHMAGDDAQAIAPLEAAIRLQPSLLPANLFLGAANLRLGRIDAAIAPLQKAVRLDPAHRDARAMLAEALVGAERYADAEPHLRRLARAAPNDPAAWFNLGNAYEEMAATAAAALRERHAGSAFDLALAAEALAQSGQAIPAFHLYRKAIAKGPPIRGVHAAVAAIYKDAGHPDWAAVEEQKEKRPKPDCARERLECAFLQRRYQDVVAGAARAAGPEAGYWRARAYGALAAQAFGRLDALPPSALSHERKAIALRDQRRYREAIEHWRQAIALAPDDPQLRLELAVTLRRNQDLAGAQEILEPLHAAAPAAPDLNYFLGDVLLARNEPARALPYLETAVRLEPAAPHAQGALGRAYALAGRPADAITHLKQALPADVDGSLRYQLARAYQAAGQADQARLALEDYESFRKAAAPPTDADAAAVTPPR